MPTKAEIQERIGKLRVSGQDAVRREYLKKLNKATGHDVVLYASAFLGNGVGKSVNPQAFQLQTQDVQGFMACLKGLGNGANRKLDLILHSPGGALEAAEQIVNYLRAKYDYIRVYVPQNAMSAACMLACAADEIVMGRQSALGPIDPQLTFPIQTGMFTAPAQALLDEFHKAEQAVAADPRTAPLWMSKMKDYPPGIIQIAEETIRLSTEKVESWLGKYMFRDKEAQERAEMAHKIAAWLGDAHLHKTHGHPISYDEAYSHGLNVMRLEDDQKIQDIVLSAYHATMVTFETTHCVRMVDNHICNGLFFSVN